MPFLIGTDEAGYGPNLGPLVVGGTAWRVPDAMDGEALFKKLSRVITEDKPDEDDPRLWIADSKEVYSRTTGLAALERGVLAAGVAQSRHMITRWSAIWDHLESDCLDRLGELNWYRDFEVPLPMEAELGSILSAAAKLRGALVDSSVELIGLRARVVPAAEFNSQVEQHGNKSNVLSWVTVELIRELIELLPSDETILVLCDKHGGRSKYQQVLQRQFPDTLVQVYQEARRESVYRMGRGSNRIEIRFSVGGETALPVALASMVAKYLRELAMVAFNDFWHRHDKKLRPSAGYPVDARRFAAEIASVQKRLKISNAVLWRQC